MRLAQALSVDASHAGASRVDALSQRDSLDSRVSDADLLARIAGGNRTALADLYQRHQRPLFRYLCQLTPDRGLAEEILQDTLVAAWRGAGGFEGRSAVRTWLFAIARRQAHDAFRRRGLPMADDDALNAIEDPNPGPEQQALQQDDAEELMRAIAQLALIHREVLVLNFVDGLTYEEMALVAGVPLGTVKSRLSNAKRALREVLRASRGAR